MIGFAYVAPMLHMNYTKILPMIAPSGVKFEALKKLAFDQSVFAGTMTVGFFLGINMIEGKSFEHGTHEVRTKWLETMMINWKLWIPANFINFYIMPIKYQVLFANFVSLFYNAALSYIHNKPTNCEHDEKKKELKE